MISLALLDPCAAAPKFYVMRRAAAKFFVAQPNSSRKWKFYQPAEYFSALTEIESIISFQSPNNVESANTVH